MKIELINWYKPEIDKKELKELSRRRNWPALTHFFIYFGALFISGYLAYLTWGTWLSILFFFIYGTIYTFSVSNWHETVHKTAFKTRWINEFFYHVTSFMADFEGFRWRWSHTFHHSNTLQTKDEYDHEIQISRPTDLIAFFLNFIPFSDLLFPHRLIKFEVLKHSLGFYSSVIEISAPLREKKKILWNSRLYVFIWLGIIVFSVYFETILPILYLLLPNYYGKPIWFLINVTQHLGAALDKKDHRESSYSLRINPIFSFLYWHMEYHLEHHMFPMVPSYNLKKLHNIIKDQIPRPFPSLFSFYKQVLPIVIKQATDPSIYFKTNIPEKHK
jgi:fatty acid desaturase